MRQRLTSLSGSNGINIAFRVQGEGPPLVLIMGYRLSSAAWPAKFVDTLARELHRHHSSIIAAPDKATSRSTGYALANMARDVAGLLDEIGIESTYLLGYSMGGAIAQEFIRQFPRSRYRTDPLRHHVRRSTRDLCRSLVVTRVMRDLDGLFAEADRTTDLGGHLRTGLSQRKP